ncbi:hypothetical protein GCM10025864_19170 [Luteimicrobium album]|uniref:Large ribosomal subunit protein bL36 n=1 Tax=Luteimicrobium album TaxID=1054550 RepID=A0ABQ6I2I1_9MICO|nr:hypothetical protein GCM10025864_19170 [Luteimicrobium album]
MKVRASLRSLKDKPGSKVVRRRGKTFVINKQNPHWRAARADGGPQAQDVPQPHPQPAGAVEGEPPRARDRPDTVRGAGAGPAAARERRATRPDLRA